jgi:hypothetical protein
MNDQEYRSGLSPKFRAIISHSSSHLRNLFMSNNFREKVNFIWQVADDILRDAFKTREYEM